ncbi:tight adherence protein B [Agrococcus carbonis]|uniref:Tight adherence protein B n=1 Tax=Agrococcus carbonis TaxID=684552 RepID=A0A1H1S4B6_9MICO|nr:tight adherence protein B [Agrococcus carbonis]
MAGAADAATTLVGRVLAGRSGALANRLDLAGIRTKPQDFAFLIGVLAVAVLAATLLLGAGWLSVIAAAASPVVAMLFLNIRIARRRDAFATQLDGTLQLLASSLRAGYSTMQALGSVAQQSEEPSASELARIVNEARIGRPVVAALEEAADRMASEDFHWTAQAIAINREVGGSLAETLDGVAHTIRERGQIRRQVKTLSSEGRLSAVILMALPFGVAGFLMIINPAYLAPLFASGLGIAMLAGGAVLMVVGGIWLYKTVEIKF